LTSVPLLECADIAFERDDLPLFQGVSFQLFPSHAVQIAGANGAGKTTLLRILATSLAATSGDILWQGSSVAGRLAAYRGDMLYLGHSAGIKPSLTPRENLAWFFRLFPSSGGDIDDALRRVNLAGFEDTPVHTLSAGQQRRVALARLVLSRARLWLLDEPFTAIDVQGVAGLEQLMADHLAGGGGVLLTSHQRLSLANLRVLQLESYAAVH